MEEKIEQLQREYAAEKQRIRGDDLLSEKGKAEALKALADHYGAYFKQELDDLNEQERELQAAVVKLKKTAPDTGVLTETELLAEQWNTNLLISKLAATGKGDFLRTAEAEAAARPGVFKVAFHKVLDVLERHFPGPATKGDNYDPFDPVALEMAGTVDLDRNKRAYTLSQLMRLYDEAEKATVSPAELKQQEELAILDRQLTRNFLTAMRIRRNLEQIRRDIMPDYFSDTVGR